MSEVHRSATHERRPNLRKQIGGFMLSLAALASLEQSSAPTTPNLPDNIKLVAVGDSYTSGHANGNVKDRFEECFRDDISYANYIARKLGIKDFVNVACSGASPQEIIEGRFNEPPQIDAVTADTDYVIMTMGANAVNLSELLEKCLNERCTVDSPLIQQTFDTLRSDDFSEQLQVVFYEIHNRAPDAAIIIASYPDMIGVSPEVQNFLIKAAGTLGDRLHPDIRTIIDTDITRFIGMYVDELNSAIKGAASEASTNGVNVFVSPPTLDIGIVPNLGKTFFLDPDNLRALGHPTELGHAGMAKNVMMTMAQAQYTLGDVRQMPDMAILAQSEAED